MRARWCTAFLGIWLCGVTPLTASASICGLRELSPPNVVRTTEEDRFPRDLTDELVAHLLPDSVIEADFSAAPVNFERTNGLFPSRAPVAHLDRGPLTTEPGFDVVPAELGGDFRVLHHGEARLLAEFAGDPSSVRTAQLSLGGRSFRITHVEVSQTASRAVVLGGQSYRNHTTRTTLSLEPLQPLPPELKPGSLQLVIDLYGTEPPHGLTIGDFFGGGEWHPVGIRSPGGQPLTLRRAVIRRSVTPG